MIEYWIDFVRFADDACLRWVTTLLHFLWQGAVIGFVVVIGERALRGRSAASRYLLNAAALLCMPICVAVTFMFVDVRVSTNPMTVAPVGVVFVDGDAMSPLTVARDAPVAAEPVIGKTNLDAAAARDSVASGIEASAVGLPNLTWLLSKTARPLAAIYLIGACLFLFRLGAALWGGHRLSLSAHDISDPTLLRIITDGAQRVGLKFAPVVGYCERVAVPTVVGLVRPIVLLPISLVGLDAELLAAVIRHELSHIRRRDVLMNLAQRVVESILFFHPAAWYVSRRMSAERELCCDDLVLASGQERLGYAQALLEVADLCLGAKAAGAAALAASGNNPSEFELRIQRLIDARPMSRLQLTRSGFAMLLLWLVLAIAAPGVFRAWALAEDRESNTAQSTPQKAESTKESEPAPSNPAASSHAEASVNESPAHRVSVLCVDEQGTPVEGAEVHLFQNIDEGDPRYLHFGPSKSDAQGKALLSQAFFSNSHGNFDRWVYARVPGKLVGATRSARWIGRQSIINPEARVKMMPSRSVDGKVTVPEGFNPRNVTVGVRTMHITTGDGDWHFESFPREANFRGLETSLPEVFECRPDAEGRIRYNDVPVRGHLYLISSGAGLGEAQWRNDWQSKSFDEPIQITIKEEKKLFGRVLSPTDEPVAGVEVLARISSNAAFSSNKPYYLSTFRSVSDAAGKFEISGLPELKFVVSIRPPDVRWVFRPRESIQGIEEAGLELVLKMETGVLISGKVLDQDGNMVEGAALSALADTEEGPGLDHDKTDHNGRYRLRIPAGRAKFYFNALPDGFKYPDPQIIKLLEIQPGQAAIEDLDFTLERKTETED